MWYSISCAKSKDLLISSKLIINFQHPLSYSKEYNYSLFIFFVHRFWGLREFCCFYSNRCISPKFPKSVDKKFNFNSEKSTTKKVPLFCGTLIYNKKLVRCFLFFSSLFSCFSSWSYFSSLLSSSFFSVSSFLFCSCSSFSFS